MRFGPSLANVKRQSIVYVLLACLATVMSATGAAASMDAISIFEAKGRPIVIAHRGYSKEFPENTLVSFR